MALSIDQVRQLVASALEVEVGLVSADTKAGDLELWDSLGHISILSEIDRVFGGVSERCPQLASANSVQEIYDALLEVV